MRAVITFIARITNDEGQRTVIQNSQNVEKINFLRMLWSNGTNEVSIEPSWRDGFGGTKKVPYFWNRVCIWRFLRFSRLWCVWAKNVAFTTPHKSTLLLLIDFSKCKIFETECVFSVFCVFPPYGASEQKKLLLRPPINPYGQFLGLRIFLKMRHVSGQFLGLGIFLIN